MKTKLGLCQKAIQVRLGVVTCQALPIAWGSRAPRVRLNCFAQALRNAILSKVEDFAALKREMGQ